MHRIGHFTNGYQFWQKVEDRRKGYNIAVNPNYSQKFLYLRAIQGHSGSTINSALQDNVPLLEGFTEYIYHVGNGKELRSIVNHGLIPGGVSLRTGRHAVFFTVINPMDTQDGLRGSRKPEDSKSKRRRKGCVQVATSSDEYVFLSHVVKFLCRNESDCIEKSGDV